MNMTLMVAFFAISAAPVYAQDQPDIAKLKEDAENVVKIISSDKGKIETYCEFADLGDQTDEAKDEQDTEKAEELSQKVDELGRKLGPEFVALADALKNMTQILKRVERLVRYSISSMGYVKISTAYSGLG